MVVSFVRMELMVVSGKAIAKISDTSRSWNDAETIHVMDARCIRVVDEPCNKQAGYVLETLITLAFHLIYTGVTLA